jgi:phospholipase/lecithinase/hemolysin
MLKRSLIASAVTLTISAGHAHAASPFATIYSFGDSLSDVGNTFLATGGARPANPYADGQYSNGPNWVPRGGAGPPGADSQPSRGRFALIQNEVNDPQAYGFTDVSDPCWTGGFTGFAGPGSECGSPGTYLFWDFVHPTALGHQLLDDAALAAIPEPSTWAMMLAGFAGIGFIGWRRARASHASLAA